MFNNYLRKPITITLSAGEWMVVKKVFNYIIYKLPYFAILNLTRLLSRGNWEKVWGKMNVRKFLVPSILPDGNIIFCAMEDHGLEWDVYHNVSYDHYYTPNKGDTVIDAGAHVGFYTLKAAKKVGPNGLVIAIEPERKNYSILNFNIRVNKLHNVIPIRAALSDHDGESLLYLAERSCSHSLISPTNLVPGIKSTKVNIVTIDSIIRKLAIPKVDLLKMDIEGAELNALKGARISLENRSIKRIIAELHLSFIQEPNKIVTFLQKFSYKVIVDPILHLLYAFTDT